MYISAIWGVIFWPPQDKQINQTRGVEEMNWGVEPPNPPAIPTLDPTRLDPLSKKNVDPTRLHPCLSLGGHDVISRKVKDIPAEFHADPSLLLRLRRFRSDRHEILQCRNVLHYIGILWAIYASSRGVGLSDFLTWRHSFKMKWAMTSFDAARTQQCYQYGHHEVRHS